MEIHNKLVIAWGWRQRGVGIDCKQMLEIFFGVMEVS